MAACQNQGARAGQRASACRQRVLAGEVEDHVVALPAAGEVLPGVVDDVAGAERADQLDVAGAAHAGDVGAEGLGDLHGERADASRRAVDQHRVAWLHLADVAQAPQGGDGGDRHRGSLLEGEVGGLERQQAFRDAGVLGEAAGGDEPVSVVDGGCVHADEHLVRSGCGLVDVLQAKDIAGAVGVLDDRSHHALTAARDSRYDSTRVENRASCRLKSNHHRGYLLRNTIISRTGSTSTPPPKAPMRPPVSPAVSPGTPPATTPRTIMTGMAKPRRNAVETRSRSRSG